MMALPEEETSETDMSDSTAFYILRTLRDVDRLLRNTDTALLTNHPRDNER